MPDASKKQKKSGAVKPEKQTAADGCAQPPFSLPEGEPVVIKPSAEDLREAKSLWDLISELPRRYEPEKDFYSFTQAVEKLFALEIDELKNLNADDKKNFLCLFLTKIVFQGGLCVGYADKYAKNIDGITYASIPEIYILNETASAYAEFCREKKNDFNQIKLDAIVVPRRSLTEKTQDPFAAPIKFPGADEYGVFEHLSDALSLFVVDGHRNTLKITTPKSLPYEKFIFEQHGKNIQHITGDTKLVIYRSEQTIVPCLADHNGKIKALPIDSSFKGILKVLSSHYGDYLLQNADALFLLFILCHSKAEQNATTLPYCAYLFDIYQDNAFLNNKIKTISSFFRQQFYFRIAEFDAFLKNCSDEIRTFITNPLSPFVLANKSAENIKISHNKKKDVQEGIESEKSNDRNCIAGKWTNIDSRNWSEEEQDTQKWVLSLCKRVNMKDVFDERGDRSKEEFEGDDPKKYHERMMSRAETLATREKLPFPPKSTRGRKPANK